MAEKIPFITKEKAEEIAAVYPTPFHIYDEKGIRKTARDVNKAFLGIRALRSILLLRQHLLPVYSRFYTKRAAALTAQALPNL